MKNKSGGKIILFYLCFFIVIVLIANYVYGASIDQKEIEYSKVVQMFQKEEIKRYYVDNSGILYLSKEEAKSDKLDLNSFEFIHPLADIEQFRDDLGELIFEQTEKGILLEYDYESSINHNESQEKM